MYGTRLNALTKGAAVRVSDPIYVGGVRVASMTSRREASRCGREVWHCAGTLATGETFACQSDDFHCPTMAAGELLQVVQMAEAS